MTLTDLRALIVDDSPEDAELLIRELERGGYRVHWTRVATAPALESALESQPWDIVFSDFTLPGYIGKPPLRVVRDRCADMPFIFVSGTIGEERAVAAMKEGAQDYILKDNLRRLVPAVRRELGEARNRAERQRAEARLAESEARYRTLFDANPVPMWVFDLETLRFLEVNEAALRQYGYSRADFLAMTIEQLRPPEDIPALHEQLKQRGAPGFQYRGTWRHVTKTGAGITVEVVSHAVRFLERDARLVAATDITPRLEAERVQAAIYEVAHAAQTAAGLPELLGSIHAIVGKLMPARNLYIALYDPPSDLLSFPYFVDDEDPPPPPRHPSNGLTEYVLRTGAPFLATAESEAQLLSLGLVRQIGAQSMDWLGVPLKSGDQTIGVLAVQTYSSGVRYADRHKTMLEFVSTQIATAITRKRADEELRQNEVRLRALVDSSLDAVITMDAHGIITGWNRRAEQMFGWTGSEVIGRPLQETIIPPQYRAAHAQGMAHFLTTGEGPILGRRIEITALHRDGKEFPIELSVSAAQPGGAWFFSAFLRDIRERKELEHQLRQSQKMEAVGRLAGGIAHDFNNILTTILGYVELLRETLPEGSDGQRDLTEVRKAGERAAALTQQLLAFSRQQVLEPVVLHVNGLVEDFERMVRRVIGEDIELRLALAPDAGNVRADSGQLQQVLMNLVVNARDAMPTGGTVVLETANLDLSPQYAESHHPVVAGPYVMLAVSDTGVGMSAEISARVFEPFFTTKERGKGTGLGLSTVYGIVKQSNGYIWVYSEVGRGTTFKIYLPRVQDRAQPSAQPADVGRLTGSETIFVAEDDSLLRPLTQGVLEKLGYTVVAAENAEQALARAECFSGPIHLLLVDVVMPGLSGRELARRLARARPETKVLYTSGYTDDAIVQHGMLEEGLNFLQKPFTPAALAKKVREVLDSP